MANTYTPKLNLAKPAHGDVNWHIPVNENWDKIDTELDKALKISGTTIDADKDWSGKNITNVNHLQAASANITSLAVSNYTLVADPTIVWYSDPTTKTKSGPGPVVVKSVTVPTGMSGTVRVNYNLKASPTGQSLYHTAYAGIWVNDKKIAGPSVEMGGFVNFTTTATVKPGDVIKLTLEAENNVTDAMNNKFEIQSAILLATVNTPTW